MTDIQQRMIEQRYFDNRLASTASINRQMHDSESGVSVETGILASFLDSIGIKKLSTDLSTWIEIFFASSFAKIFSFGLNTLPNVSASVGDLRQLSILEMAEIKHLGLGNYFHLKAPLFAIGAQRMR